MSLSWAFALMPRASRTPFVPPHALGKIRISRATAPFLLTLTPQTDDFANGSGISAVNGTSEVNLVPANAYNDTYTVSYSVSVTINGHSSQYGTATLLVAIETNDGSGWVERVTYSYPCGYPSGPPPYAPRTCSSWTQEQKAIAVSSHATRSSKSETESVACAPPSVLTKSLGFLPNVPASEACEAAGPPRLEPSRPSDFESVSDMPSCHRFAIRLVPWMLKPL